jgi:demethylmenaquinone methyltransferase/2-methoxy-6-polyprenyl-1,4-benzoquinol methylase
MAYLKGDCIRPYDGLMSVEFTQASGGQPAWRGAELANPHGSPEKAGKVQRMFSAIAESYDLNNRVHSLWQDQRWRRFAVKTARVKPGDAVLDVACGTGDLTQLFARSSAASVVGSDFTPAMLEVARKKLATQPEGVQAKVTYEEGDAQALRFADASFDVVSIAFGIRNVEQPRRALAEFARVLKPGGRLVVLEFDGQPRNGLVRWFNGLYCRRIMPRTATLISGDTSGAYKYLPASVGTFMTRAEMEGAIGAAGFDDVSSSALSMGICVCYRGTRKGR